MKILKNLYLTDRFFRALAGVILLFALAFAANWLFYFAILSLIVFLTIAIYDTIQLFDKNVEIKAERTVAKVLSMGDDNEVALSFENSSKIPLNLEIIDEIPFQFQKRNFNLLTKLPPNETNTLTYRLRPPSRGEYVFGNINIFSISNIGLVKRRHVTPAETTVAVYPSTVLMKKFELFSVQRYSSGMGVRKIRRIGHSYEFDHIRSYVTGDDPRSINWKASGRRSQLMVNNFVDEKAQQIYCLLDKSRAMQMPFDGLTLLDHAINTTLMISSVALQKHDKSGLLSFSNKIGTIIKAGTGKKQLHQIYKALYREKENQYEADYELMYNAIRRFAGGRSLLFLFTNFESVYAMERLLPILRRINRLHLLVVVFFKNSQITELAETVGNDVQEVYSKTIARKFLLEKEFIARELKKHKMQVVFTTPEDLPVGTINKYFELKARGMI